MTDWAGWSGRSGMLVAMVGLLATPRLGRVTITAVPVRAPTFAYGSVDGGGHGPVGAEHGSCPSL